MRRGITFFYAVSFLLVAVSGDEGGFPRHIAVASAASTALADDAKDARRAAMLSVYYHALFGETPPPDDRRPMPLEEAARILREDKSELAESRRRRAIARLAAADFANPLFRRALTILGAPLEKISEMQLKREDAPGHTEEKIATFRNDVAAMGKVLQLLEQVSAPTDKQCPRTPPISKLEWIPDRRLAKVAITLSVNRMADGLDGLRRTIDPQSWDQCSDFFVASYVAEEVGGQYPVDAEYNAIPATKPPTPGTAWKAANFEDFAVTWGVKFSWFKQILAIDAKTDPTTYRFDFALKKSVRSGVLGDERDGGLDVDEGYASAKLRPDGWIDVEATKALRFSERPFLTKLLDTWAVVALAAMGDELWDLVCCVP